MQKTFMNESKNMGTTSMHPREAERWRQQGAGSNRGKGPRSYQRTDDRILDDINDRLCDNPYLDASNIELGIKEGDVILMGSVHTREDKRLAEEIAENVTGVKNVENRLRVNVRSI